MLYHTVGGEQQRGGGIQSSKRSHFYEDTVKGRVEPTLSNKEEKGRRISKE